jgi:hypothetical protein
MTNETTWRSRTSQRVMVDTRSGRVGRLAEETHEGVILRALNSDDEWLVPARWARPATPEEVAAALLPDE